jgi:hypothetical protein
MATTAYLPIDKDNLTYIEKHTTAWAHRGTNSE